MCFIPQYKKAYPSLSLLNLAVFKQFERAKITSGKAAINLRERQLLRFHRWFVRPRRFVHFKLRMLKKNTLTDKLRRLAYLQLWSFMAEALS